jgi:hypothetical protein
MNSASVSQTASRNQPLHRRRARQTRALGQLPAVLALNPREQPEQEQPDRAPRLDAREPARDSGRDLVEQRPPGRRLYAAQITKCHCRTRPLWFVGSSVLRQVLSGLVRLPV